VNLFSCAETIYCELATGFRTFYAIMMTLVIMSSRETFVHFFHKCPVTSGWIFKFNTHFKIVWDAHDLNFDMLYWFGDLNGLLDRQSLLLYDIFRYQLWSMRQRKLINYDLIISGTVNTLRTIFAIKPSIRTNLLLVLLLL
jgi:hypothetical protein